MVAKFADVRKKNKISHNLKKNFSFFKVVLKLTISDKRILNPNKSYSLKISILIVIIYFENFQKLIDKVYKDIKLLLILI
jgi:hypothetical protein